MASSELSAWPATKGHSLYAAFAAFSVACFVLTLFSDLAFWATVSIIWETASVWLLTVGLLAAGLAIVAGFIDLARSRSVHGLGQPRLVVVGQFAALALSIVNVFVHSRDGYTAVVPQGLLLSSIVVLVVFVSTLAGRATDARRQAGDLA